jgi:hypothetical protein
VEALAATLEDDHGFRPWLDAWVLAAGADWQTEMALALEETPNCVVCIGASEPDGWFREEIQKAMSRRRRGDRGFRVIPVLLPTARDDVAAQLKSTFLSNLNWVNFAKHARDEAIRQLVCGIKGEPPGRPRVGKVLDARGEKPFAHLLRLKEIAEHLPDEVRLDLARKYAVEYVEVDG